MGADRAARGAPDETERRWLSRWVLVVLTLLGLAIGAWLYRWMIDDGFIYLRVVRQIQAGHGPVFNAGERVEIATSPLWLWLLTLGDLVLPLPLEWIAVLGGITLTLVGATSPVWRDQADRRRDHQAAQREPIRVQRSALVLVPGVAGATGAARCGQGGVRLANRATATRRGVVPPPARARSGCR